MAIKPGEIITYKDLTDHFFNWIKNSANLINVAETDEEYNRKVPEQWRNFSERIVKERTGVKESRPQSVGALVELDPQSKIERVSINTVIEEFNAFMRSRGLDVPSVQNTQITTRGIINFWNNVAIFCSTNIVLVSAGITLDGESVPLVDKTVRRMYKSNTSWPTAPSIGNSELIVASDVTTMLSNLEEVVNKVSKMHQLIYKISAFSSSSSCCSSSSSSSSSSIYIAYMKI